MRKTIVCLANSVKHGGRCIAGKDRDGTWVRPISGRPGAELAVGERKLHDGREPHLLDILDLEVLTAAPRGHQVENFLSHPAVPWRKVGKLSWEAVARFADRPSTLWLNGFSTHQGVNDKIPASRLSGIQSSLLLVEPQALTLRVSQPGLSYGDYKRVLRSHFQLGNHTYDIKVTDPEAMSRMFTKDDGEYAVKGPCLLCISLGETHTDGFAYKLAASVLTPGGLHAE